VKTTVPQIANLPHVVKTLATVFDIDFSRPILESLWFRVQASESFSPFAGTAAGGVFLLGSVSGSILYVTSEG
jgi:hypothetical protein